MIIEYEVDCWKCNEMHPGIATSQDQFFAIINGGGDWQHTVRVLDTERRRIRWSKNDGWMVLLPWFGNKGIVFGTTGIGFQVYPWVTARWEFADYGGGTLEWRHKVMAGGRG